MTKNKDREDRWLYIIRPLSSFLYKVLLSQFDELAISITCDHYGILKTRTTLKHFIERANVDSLKELSAVENHLRIELQKLDIEEDDLELFEEKFEGKKALPKVFFNGMLLSLTILTTFGFFGVLISLMLVDIPSDNSQPLFILLGTLGGGWTMALSYFFGGSLQNRNFSENKPTTALTAITDESINNIVDKKIERKFFNHGNKNSASS